MYHNLIMTYKSGYSLLIKNVLEYSLRNGELFVCARYIDGLKWSIYGEGGNIVKMEVE